MDFFLFFRTPSKASGNVSLRSAILISFNKMLGYLPVLSQQEEKRTSEPVSARLKTS